MKTPYDYLFREYDIRGRLGEAELNTQSVGQIARAYEMCIRDSPKSTPKWPPVPYIRKVGNRPKKQAISTLSELW